MDTPQRSIRPAFRLQDAVALLLALAFAGLLLWTLSHLGHGFRALDDEIARTRHSYATLLDLSGGQLPDENNLSAWEAAIFRAQSELNTIDGERATVETQLHRLSTGVERTQTAVQRTEDEALKAYFSGSHPWDPGVEPELWFKEWRPQWQAWHVRQGLCSALNRRYAEHRQALDLAQRAMQAAQDNLGRLGEEAAHLDDELQRLRGVKNTAAALLTDPLRRAALQRSLAGSTTAKLSLALLHLPLVLYCAVFLVAYLFRLALLREWLGSKRLRHAD